MTSLTSQSRLKNVVQLGLGYGLGQGALLLSQSALMLGGHSSFIGQFGLIYTFNTLMYYLVDCGSPVVLAGETLRTKLNDQRLVGVSFWNFSAVRLLFAVAAALLMCVAARVSKSEFALGYALGTIPGLLIYSANAAGVLDGYERSGWSGVTSAAPALTTAVALSAAFGEPREAGLLLGTAYSVGTIVSVAAQHWLVARHCVALRLPRLSARGILPLFKEGAFYLLSTMPGQFFYRGQLAILASAVSAPMLGNIVYAKQLTNVALQGLYFIRRAEYPHLLTKVQFGMRPLSAIWTSQRATIGASVLGSAGLAVLGSLGHFWGPLQLKESAAAIVVLSPTVVASGLFSIMNQGYAACRRLGVAAIAANTMLALGLGLCWALRALGPLGLSISESIANLAAATGLAVGLAGAAGALKGTTDLTQSSTSSSTVSR